jgi:mannose-6-phosphate isomerase-like protein (cupin superfamily)
MKVIRGSEIKKASNLDVLISKKNAGAENCQAGIGRIQINNSLPEEGFSKHPTEEVSFIIKGQIRLETPDKTEYLNEGDIVFMPKNKEHRNINVGDTEAEVFWVTSPPTL